MPPWPIVLAVAAAAYNVLGLFLLIRRKRRNSDAKFVHASIPIDIAVACILSVAFRHDFTTIKGAFYLTVLTIYLAGIASAAGGGSEHYERVKRELEAKVALRKEV